MNSDYRPIGKSNFLNHQKQIQTVLQDHNPRTTIAETTKNERGETEDNYITIPLETIEKLVHDELRCPICLGVFNSTLTLSTCLHRFCSDCFQRSMRELKSQHGCPQCRAKLPSRRVSKSDATIDRIVAVFQKYTSDTPITIKRGSEEVGPMDGVTDASITMTNMAGQKRSRRSAADVMNQETEQIFEVEKYRAAYLARVEEFKKRQKEMLTPGTPYYQQFFNPSDRKYQHQNPRQRQDKKNKAQKTAAISSPSSSTSFISRRVFLAVFPVPQWRPDDEARPFFENNPAISAETLTLKLPFLKVNAELNIGELKQFFHLKLKFSEPVYQRLEILFPNQNQAKQTSTSSEPVIEQWVILDECLTVVDVMDCLWNKNSELVFYYRCAPLETATESLVPVNATSHKNDSVTATAD